MNAAVPPPASVSFLNSHWTGQRPLWSAFWIVGVLGMNLFALGSWLMTIIVGQIPVIRPSWIHIGELLCNFAYFFFAAVCVWRCAKNSWSSRKGIIERQITAPLVAVVGLVIVGNLLSQVAPRAITAAMNALASLPISWEMLPALTPLAAVWVYWDATRHKIGRVKEGTETLNMSAGVWSVTAMFFWFLMLPLYLIKRKSLITLANTHPVEPKGRWITCTGLFLLSIVLTLGWLTRG